jgi:hypothetical protein
VRARVKKLVLTQAVRAEQVAGELAQVAPDAE